MLRGPEGIKQSDRPRGDHLIRPENGRTCSCNQAGNNREEARLIVDTRHVMREA
jgi:hypothetical protein